MVSDKQIKRNCYAAYQFTAIPYVTMSILNLIASLSAPNYPAMYIVHYHGLCNPSKMDNIAASGGGGVPGAISPRQWRRWKRYWT
jgi:hypothetical protein